MFDFLLNEEGRIAKRQRVLTDKAQTAEDRESATHWLAGNGSPKAVVALLSRFDLTLEHQINDKTEKQRVYDALVELGVDATGRPLRAHLRKCRQVGWPLKLLEALDGKAAAVDLVIDLLGAEVTRRDFKPDRKVDLLSWLSDRKDSRAVDAASPLLTDFDEGVRCAAVAVITAQADDRGCTALEPRLLDPKEESNRLKVRIATAFAQRRWKVNDAPAVQAALPPGFLLRDGVVFAT